MICPPDVFDAAGALFYRNAANGAFMFTSRYRLSDSEPLFQTASMYPDVFKPRPAESHKGTYGTLAVIGGAEGMSGAVVLAATAAAYAGCGKVWAGFNQRQLPFAVIDGRPEIMLATAQNLLLRNDADARADRHKARLPERQLPCDAADHIDAERHDRVDCRQREYLRCIRVDDFQTYEEGGKRDGEQRTHTRHEHIFQQFIFHNY